MTVKKLLAYLFVLGILLAVLLVLIFRGPTKNDLRLEIQRANYCGSNEDCETLANAEAITCTPYVNKAELERIQTLIDEVGIEGDSTCAQPPPPSCLQFQCK